WLYRRRPCDGFEGKGKDIGDCADGAGRGETPQLWPWRSGKGVPQQPGGILSQPPECAEYEQGSNEDCINAQAAGVSGWFRQMFGKGVLPADEIRASAKKRYSAGCALLAVGITFTVVSLASRRFPVWVRRACLRPMRVLQALLQDSFMAENAAAMGSFALGAVRITGWRFAAVTAVFVWMITAGASRLKASKTLLRLAEAAEGFDCKKGLPLEAVDEKKARALSGCANSSAMAG
ncbi:hypothetical protein ACKVMQ_13705, partial [Faecalibacterium hattorii]